MKTINYLFLSLVITLLSVSFTSCSDDNDDNTKTTKSLPKLLTWSYGGKTSIEYDSQNRITKYSEADTNGYGSTIEYFYDTNGKPSKVTITGNWSGDTYTYLHNFTYKEGNKVLVTEKRSGENFGTTDTLYINDAGQILKFRPDANNYATSYDYEYYSNGNVKSVREKRGESRDVEEQFLEYDNNKGIYSAVNVPSWLLMYDGDDIYIGLTINNKLKTKWGDSDPETYTYTYNESGYPTKITFVSDSEDYFTIEYTSAK